MTTLAAQATEPLEDGHLATTPDGDNLVLDHARTEAAAFAALTAANGGRVHDDAARGWHLRDLGIGSPFGNAALLTRPLTDELAAGFVGELRGFYGDREGGPFLVFSPWRTPDLGAHGLARVGHPPLMFRPAGGVAPLAPGLRIVEVADVDTLADFERTLVEAYPAPEMLPWQRGAFMGEAILATAWRLYVGYQDGEAVATAAAFVGPNAAVVELVSTRPECRGRGYGAAVTAAATFAEPRLPATLIASDLGRGVYDRLGYLPLQRHTLWLGFR